VKKICPYSRKVGQPATSRRSPAPRCHGHKASRHWGRRSARRPDGSLSLRHHSLRGRAPAMRVAGRRFATVPSHMPLFAPEKSALHSREDRHYLIDHAPVRRTAARSKRPQGSKVPRPCRADVSTVGCLSAVRPALCPPRGLVRPAATEQRKAESISRSRPFFGMGPDRFRDRTPAFRLGLARQGPSAGIIHRPDSCRLRRYKRQHGAIRSAAGAWAAGRILRKSRSAPAPRSRTRV
jgi:hypothetical protein